MTNVERFQLPSPVLENCFLNQKDRPDWMSHLDEHGWAVVPAAHSNPSVLLDGLWRWLAELGTGITAEDPTSWLEEAWPPQRGGILSDLGIGHAEFMWAARTDQNVKKIFETLWGTDDLLSSFDGANLSLPAKEAGPSWAHLDQSYQRHGLHCVQGILNLVDCGDSDGGLTIYSSSHRLLEQFYAEFLPEIEPERNFLPLSEQQTQWFAERCAEVKVNANAGDLILFDSRCVHWARAPTGGQFRAALYICMMPRTLASEQDLQRRIAAFENGETSSHWPAPFHAKRPSSESTKWTSPPRTSLVTPLVKRLVGYD